MHLLHLLLLLPASSAAAGSGPVLGNWGGRDDFRPAVADLTTDDAADNRAHEVVFAVHQRNLDELEQRLLSVADPASPDYGAYLSYDQVHTLTANPASSQAVRAWCRAHVCVRADDVTPLPMAARIAIRRCARTRRAIRGVHARAETYHDRPLHTAAA